MTTTNWRLRKTEFTTEWGQTLVAERVYETKEEAIEDGYEYTFTIDGWDVYENYRDFDETKYVLVERNVRYIVKSIVDNNTVWTSSKYRFRENAENYMESILRRTRCENRLVPNYRQMNVKCRIEEIQV